MANEHLNIIKLKISEMNMRKEGNFCYVISLPKDVVIPDDKVVFIKIRDFLDKSDAQHQEIRERGDGRYSIWGESIYFSTLENVHIEESTILEIYFLDDKLELLFSDKVMNNLSSDNQKISQIIRKNLNTNNSFFSNFVHNPNKFLKLCKRQGIEMYDKEVFVIGIGRIPYTAMRFLAEGARFCFVNDLMKIQKNFSTSECDNIINLSSYFNNNIEDAIKNLFSKQDDELSVRDLQIFDEIEFESINFTRKVDLTFSTSVLEHVMNVSSFYKKLNEVTLEGGWTFHTIDLKDHLNFFNPLEFLKLSVEDYRTINTENRLRAVDHLKLLEQNNFAIKDIEYRYINPKDYVNDKSLINSDLLKTKDFNHIPEVVSQNHHSKLHPDFQIYSRRELSILEIDVLAQKI